MSRPEHNPKGATSFYNKKEALKYSTNNKMKQTQSILSKRAIQLLQIPAGVNGLILDIGCGSGFSHQKLLREGHLIVGTDINRTMLDESVRHTTNRLNRAKGGSDGISNSSDNNNIRNKKRKHQYDNNNHNMKNMKNNNTTYGIADLLESDMGDGLGFRRNIFDGVISISALQWLCYPSKRHKGKGNQQSKTKNKKIYNTNTKKKKKNKKYNSGNDNNVNPHGVEERLKRFFRTLRTCLRKKAKAVLQFYPETAIDCYKICKIANEVGFNGGLLIDYPAHMDGKKYYLVISFDG